MGGPLIRTAADVPEGFTARTQVCVVGSGAGGAVAAALIVMASSNATNDVNEINLRMWVSVSP